MTVARNLAEYALALRFQDIPREAVSQAKRLLLDSLGCAIGGYDSDASKIIQGVVKRLRGPEEATIIGSGLKTSCLNAVLANGAMLRYLDYNDVAFVKASDGYRYYHPSETIPTVLALGEREHISGEEAIAAIVLGYDASFWFMDGIVGPGIEQKGWNQDTRGAYVIPLIAGRILGLQTSQIENAIGVSAGCHGVLGILDSPSETLTMAKNIRFPAMAHGAILATMLAQDGFTGPTNVIEGQGGFVDAIMRGDYDLAKLSNNKERHTISGNCCIKSIIADYSAHGHLLATLNIVREHNLRPEDIAQIRIRGSHRCVEHTGDAAKKFPGNKETADHSSYYLTAIAIIDREIGPDQFSPGKYADPRVIELIHKITLEADAELDGARYAGITKITTVEGKSFESRVDIPKGHPENAMTDEEIVEKFCGMASKRMKGSQMDQIVNTVFDLERLDDIGKLNGAMTFRNLGAAA